MITSVTKQYDDFDANEVVGYVMVKDGKTSFVPNKTANQDYQAIQNWIADGNSVVDPNE